MTGFMSSSGVNVFCLKVFCFLDWTSHSKRDAHPNSAIKASITIPCTRYVRIRRMPPISPQQSRRQGQSDSPTHRKHGQIVGMQRINQGSAVFYPCSGQVSCFEQKNRRNRRFWDMLPNGQTGQSPAFFEESSFAESDLDPAADGEGCSFS